MRFACQSCGKAYNLPEEKIADKSNVKLKCRVCGAIVEVKRQGEVVASMLGDGDSKRTRVSEAPAPLTSMMPDDSDDATHAIALSDQILSEAESSDDAASALMGHVKSALGQRGLVPLPPPPPTGFGSPPPATGLGSTGFGSAGFGAAGFGSAGFASSGFGSPPPPGFGASVPAGFAPTPVPPPLSAPDLPDPMPFARSDSPVAPPLPSSFGASGPGSPPPPLPEPGGSSHGGPGHGSSSHGSPHLSSPHLSSPGLSSLQNGSNGAAPRFGDGLAFPDEPSSPLGMGAGSMTALSAGGAAPMTVPGAMAPSGDMGSYSGLLPVDVQSHAPSSDTTRKMLAALATGILIGFIIARLFF